MEKKDLMQEQKSVLEGRLHEESKFFILVPRNSGAVG